MSSYSIKDLEKISGIKAHTIKIWESRYQIIEPERTESNRRIYSDDDLKKIIRVSQLVNSVSKISKVAYLSDRNLKRMVESNNSHSLIINKLKKAMLAYDEDAFNKTLKKQIEKSGLEKTFFEGIVPFLEHVGLLWLNDKACPAQEHFSSNLIRKILFTEIDKLGTVRNQKSTFVLFLPCGEDHEINLLFLNYLLKKKGCRVLYLGSNTPQRQIESTAMLNPNSVAITYSVILKKPEFETTINSYNHSLFKQFLVIEPRYKLALNSGKVLVISNLKELNNIL